MNHTHLTSCPPVTYTEEDLSIEVNCRGKREYTKASYPVKYGIFSRLETSNFIFEFNLDHDICHARSKTDQWIHPQEWLKRTMGNDWVYYSTGGYAGVFESIGEYYLPNFMYTTNSLLGGKPFLEPEVKRMSQGWYDTLSGVSLKSCSVPEPISRWVEKIKSKTPADLAQKAHRLFNISGVRSSVLPPDARHSDYDVIPLIIADGCLYKCRFCRVKSKNAFALRSRQDIDRQIRELKELYSRDLINYNSLFIGEHDALNAPTDLIVYAARTAYESLGFGTNVMTRPRLYFFGSVDALLNAEESLFKRLNQSSFHTFINIGLESADPATLERIGKPITPEKVTLAFERIQAINKTYDRVEMTCNFIMDENLPPRHNSTMMELVRDKFRFSQSKGSVYLSPLQFGKPSREVLFDFYHLKTRSRLPMFLYIIQRL